MLAEFYKAARGVLSPLPIVDVLRQTAPLQLHRRENERSSNVARNSTDSDMPATARHN